MTQQNKTALITGASRGIGRAIALRLAKDGFNVSVGYAGNRTKAEEVVAEIASGGGKSLAIQADLAQKQQVTELFTQTAEAFGGIDVVVNSAGIMELSPIAEGNTEIFDRIMATNLRGTFLVLSQAARHVRKGGRIVALSTSALIPAFPAYGAYIASKAGVEALVRTLANELRGRTITVNAISPGPVATELFFTGKSEEQVARMAKMPPLERLGEPEDIAAVVSFLAGSDGGWVNGQVVRVNGGFV